MSEYDRSAVLHPVCAVVRLRAARKALWLRQMWAGLPESAHPAAIQHEEVDRILANPEAILAHEAAFYEADDSARSLAREIEHAESALADDRRWRRTVDALQLNNAEQDLFSLAAAVALDPSLGRAYAYLHDQFEMTHATVWLSSALYGRHRPGGMSADSPLLVWRLVRRAPETMQLPEMWRGWVATPAIVAWLTSQDTADLPHGASLKKPAELSGQPVLYQHAYSVLERFHALGTAASARTIEFEIIGPAGSGRGTLAGQFAAAQQRPLLRVDGAVLASGVTEQEAGERAVEALRAATLRDALLYWDAAVPAEGVIRNILLSYPGFRIVGRRVAQTDPLPLGMLFRSVELPALTRAQREQLWTCLSEQEPPRQIRDWLLSPAEIARIAQVDEVGDEAVVQACRRPGESLSLLVRLPLPYAPEDLVVAPALREQLDEIERQVRLRWQVYEDWGFERLCPNGAGIVALFAGPTGTGKTMAAQVLARKLGLELYRLDPAQVVNKYIGETEKRLKTVFDECDRAHFLLLIDECEGMFGQRFTSKDAHDRYANLEIDYLLQRLERFQGVALLATNRKGDLDSAFLRRIRFVIDFLHPGPAERRRLWQSALPECSPSGERIRGDIDWDLLGEKVSLTGAEIKLAALNSAFLAFAEGQRIGMSHLLTAIRREFAKKGQTLRIPE